MAAQVRVYRQRIRSVQATKKITKAMELIAASRVVKARQRVAESSPYTHALTRAVSAVATFSDAEHPLTTEPKNPRKAGVLVITSDRGLAGAYSINALKASLGLVEHLESQGKAVTVYLVGNKAKSYFKFRHREYARDWTGFSDSPTIEVVQEIGRELTTQFLKGSEDGGLDEIHVVYTKFVNMVRQEPTHLRLLPLEVVEGREPPAEGEMLPEYDFEPDAETVLDALLPKYVTNTIWNCLLQSAVSELASRQRAMKSATDNAEDLIKTYTRLANQARQAAITQEISEIVGGASALADAAQK